MENKLPVRFKNLTLDLEHPESGIEAIKNLTKIYEKEKEEYKTLFNWAEQEIEDAKLIALDRMNMLCRRGVSIVWYCNKVHGKTMLSTNFGTVEGGDTVGESAPMPSMTVSVMTRPSAPPSMQYQGAPPRA